MRLERTGHGDETPLTGPHRFYGWHIVAACFAIATVVWSLTVFGFSVYLHALTQSGRWSLATLSFGVTLFYLTGALFSLPVGYCIQRGFLKSTLLASTAALCASVIGLPRAGDVIALYLCFALMGVAYAGLGTTALSAILAPWFDRLQGRAISIAFTGASVGGIAGAPLLLLSVSAFGFSATVGGASLIAAAVILPLVVVVIRRTPADMGLEPDGGPTTTNATTHANPAPDRSVRDAIGSVGFISIVGAFGIALAMQLAFLTHQIKIVASSFSESGTALVVSATGAAALAGRILFSSIADRISLRGATAVFLAVAAAVFLTLAFTSSAAVVAVACVVYGTTFGNVTALCPILIRHEFGLRAFGTIYGTAATVVGLISACGPGLWGALRDSYGSFTPALTMAAALDLIAGLIVLSGAGLQSLNCKERQR